MKIIQLIALIGLTAATSAFAATNSDQAAIDTLQKQIAAVSAQMNSALQSQQAANQKAITDLQTQVQAQLTHMQTEINQLQQQLTGELKQVQSEAVKSGSAPVETAVPGPGTPDASTPKTE
jgi:Skp family chaperone for outer membrane proteins